jgi:hypothetical protein
LFQIFWKLGNFLDFTIQAKIDEYAKEMATPKNAKCQKQQQGLGVGIWKQNKKHFGV